MLLNYRISIWHRFVSNCRSNLHCVLFISTINRSLRRYCRHYPTLLTHATINRIGEWSDESLKMVSNKFICEHLAIRDELVHPINRHIVHVHRSAHFYSSQLYLSLHRPNFLSLRNLMDFVYTYMGLIGILIRKFCISILPAESLLGRYPSLWKTMDAKLYEHVKGFPLRAGRFKKLLKQWFVIDMRFDSPMILMPAPAPLISAYQSSVYSLLHPMTENGTPVENASTHIPYGQPIG